MMWKEFEEIAGYEVSYDDYSNIIEPMYMAIPDGISKQEFVKMLNKKRFALPTRQAIIRDMKKRCEFLFENCGLKSFYEEKSELDRIAKQYAKRFWGMDWSNDLDKYCFFRTGYAYCGCKMDRGCSYPFELVIGSTKDGEYERITMVR